MEITLTGKLVNNRRFRIHSNAVISTGLPELYQMYNNIDRDDELFCTHLVQTGYCSSHEEAWLLLSYVKNNASIYENVNQ